MATNMLRPSAISTKAGYVTTTSAALALMRTGLRPIRSDNAPKSGNAMMWASRIAAVTTNIAPAPSSVTFLRYVGM